MNLGDGVECSKDKNVYSEKRETHLFRGTFVKKETSVKGKHIPSVIYYLGDNFLFSGSENLSGFKFSFKFLDC